MHCLTKTCEHYHKQTKNHCSEHLDLLKCKVAGACFEMSSAELEQVIVDAQLKQAERMAKRRRES